MWWAIAIGAIGLVAGALLARWHARSENQHIRFELQAKVSQLENSYDMTLATPGVPLDLRAGEVSKATAGV